MLPSGPCLSYSNRAIIQPVPCFLIDPKPQNVILALSYHRTQTPFFIPSKGIKRLRNIHPSIHPWDHAALQQCQYTLVVPLAPHTHLNHSDHQGPNHTSGYSAGMHRKGEHCPIKKAFLCFPQTSLDRGKLLWEIVQAATL